jgi:phosphoribosyl 1,2-cyclic phosphodiesterase
MQASVLASGSAGNCVYVEAAGAAVLLDCGLSVPELRRRLSSLGQDLSKIQGVFVTHDHGDHVGSSVALARKLGIPHFSTAGTQSVLRRLPPELTRTVRADEPLEVGPFTIAPIATPHDGIESVAFRVTAGRKSIGVLTDLGYVPRRLVEQFAGVDALVVEFNHDERMVIEGPYPPSLKSRILGPRGHLSNEAGAGLAAQVLHPGLGRVVLAHLSETNNTPDLARRAFERANTRAHASMVLELARQAAPTDLFDV